MFKRVALFATGTPKNDASTAKTGAMQNGASTGTQDMDIDAFLEGGFESLSDRPELEAEVGRPKRAAVTTGAVDKQAKLLAQDKKGKKSKKRGNKGQKTASGKIEQLDNEEEQQAADMHPKTGGVKASGPGAVQRELKSHKEELEALKQADPSFYEYLQQSDKGLLEFDSEDEDGLDAAADSDDDDDMSEGEGGHESDGDAVEEGVDSDEEPAVKPSKAKAAKPAQKEKRQQPDVSAKAEQPRGKLLVFLKLQTAMSCCLLFCEQVEAMMHKYIRTYKEGHVPMTRLLELSEPYLEVVTFHICWL